MAYKIMKSLIYNGEKTTNELKDMADVYYGAGRLTEEEYNEIIVLINQKEEM